MPDAEEFSSDTLIILARILAGQPQHEGMDATLRIEFYFDDEAGNWHYRVPALHINGGGLASRDEAECDCMDAICFALRGDPRDYDSDAVMLDISVA